MSGAPVNAFLAELRDLYRTGFVVVGAITDGEDLTFDGVGWAHCPFCSTLILAMVVAGAHAVTGQPAGGTRLLVPCEHRDLIEAMGDAVALEVETGSMLPERS